MASLNTHTNPTVFHLCPSATRITLNAAFKSILVKNWHPCSWFNSCPRIGIGVSLGLYGGRRTQTKRGKGIVFQGKGKYKGDRKDIRMKE
jgi:hypothetical protein